MKTSPRNSFGPISVAALLSLAAILTGCNTEQDEQLSSAQLSSALSTADYRTGQVAPHIRTAGAGGVYFVSSMPTSDHHRPHQPRIPQLRHHGSQQPQQGPAAVN